MKWLNYYHLHYFWIVAKEESVTKARERLRFNPTTITMLVGRLDEPFGQIPSSRHLPFVE